MGVVGRAGVPSVEGMGELTSGLAPTLTPDTRRGAGRPVADRHWAGDARFAAGCAALFTAPVMLVARVAGQLPLPTALLCVAAGLAVLAVLLPSRVSVREGVLSVTGPLGRRRVRTDALVCARLSGTIAVRVVLRDVSGGRVAFDARVLTRDPALGHLVGDAVRRSRERGTLPAGADGLRGLPDRVSTR